MKCPALKLPVYFQSLHQLHRYCLQTGALSMFARVCVCVCDGGGIEGELRMIDMELLVL